MNDLILPGPLVTAMWLAANLSHRDLVVLDASLTPVSETPAQVAREYLPHSRIFDIEKIKDHSSQLPHMMPNAEQFQSQMRELGISPSSQIVIYDRVGVYSSPRARWMLKSMGHHAVAVLDGGLPAWKAAGLKTFANPITPKRTNDFIANPCKGFCDAPEVAQAIKNRCASLFDARARERYLGLAKEPRAGLRAGHIPTAINLPFLEVLKNGHYLPRIELEKLFDQYGSRNTKSIFSCGSGVTACIIALAAEIAGRNDLVVYDGSWAEWGASELPIETD